ncbi:hypothetical protein IWZ01DRAFT_135382 [Phyllosticta capitalensis]
MSLLQRPVSLSRRGPLLHCHPFAFFVFVFCTALFTQLHLVHGLHTSPSLRFDRALLLLIIRSTGLPSLTSEDKLCCLSTILPP